MCRYLQAEGLQVVEVDRPDRRMRCQRGKSHAIDAEAAARSVLAGTATAVPKKRDGIVESIRALRTIALRAIGVDYAGQFLLTAGERPERLRSEAALAHHAEWRRSQPQADAANGIVSSAAATAPPTGPCVWQSLCACAAAHGLVATSNAGPKRVSPSLRSCTA